MRISIVCFGCFYGVFLTFFVGVMVFFYWCFWCVVCGDFLGCLVDMVCLFRRDGFFDEFDFDHVITFLFLVQSLSGFDKCV